MINWLFTKTPLFFLIQPLWRDEAFSYFFAKKNLLEILIFSTKDFSPPLYHLLLHYWIKIFGGSEISIRSLSLIFYWATLYIVYDFLIDIFKIKSSKALFYTLLAGINPLLLYFAFEGRMYTLLAFFGTLSFYLFLRKKTNSYIFFSILGLYTHYFMLLLIIAQYLIEKSKKQIKIFLGFLPWIIFTLINRGLVIESFWIKKPSINNLINFLGNLYTGYENDFYFYEKSIFFLSLTLLTIVIVGYLKFRDTNNFTLFKYLFIWSIGIPFFIIVISFLKPIFLPRYLIFSTVGLILLLIFIIDKLPLISKILIIIFIFQITINYNNLQIKNRTKSNLKKTVNEINFLMKKDDIVYVTSELDYFTAQYYFNNQKEKVYIWGKEYEEIPNYVGKVLISKNKIKNSLPIYPNRAFVIYLNGEYLIKSIY